MVSLVVQRSSLLQHNCMMFATQESGLGASVVRAKPLGKVIFDHQKSFHPAAKLHCVMLVETGCG